MTKARPQRTRGHDSHEASDEFEVSVVMPLYNKGKYVRSAVQSVLAQRLQPREVIIVDDGSTDAGADQISDLVGGPVRLVRQDNAGPGPARNRGIAEAHGRWVAFLDADDLWLDDHLSTLSEVSRTFPDAGVVGSNFILGESAPARPAVSEMSTIDFFGIEPPGPFYTSSVAVRRTILAGSEGFGDYWPGEDAELWARLALDHQCAATTRVTALYRQQTSGLMEQSAGLFAKTVFMHPIVQMLDAALADRNYAPRHRAIARYRDQWLAIFARQALVAARPDIASAYLAQMQPRSPEAGLLLRLLSKSPAPLVRTAMRVRSRLRSVGL